MFPLWYKIDHPKGTPEFGLSLERQVGNRALSPATVGMPGSAHPESQGWCLSRRLGLLMP